MLIHISDQDLNQNNSYHRNVVQIFGSWREAYIIKHVWVFEFGSVVNQKDKSAYSDDKDGQEDFVFTFVLLLLFHYF